MHVVIRTAALPEHAVPISDKAARQVRMGFNPSQSPRVDAIKALAAALISECQLAGLEADAGREAALAMTAAEEAAMWGVKAATAGL